MSKKIIALILGTMMTVSLVGCSNRESKEDNTKTFAIENDEKYSNLDGEWSKDITLKIFDEKFDKLFGEVRDKCKMYGLTFNEKGEEFILEGEELLARAILHENDHLNGVLYVDHVK